MVNLCCTALQLKVQVGFPFAVTKLGIATAASASDNSSGKMCNLETSLPLGR